MKKDIQDLLEFAPTHLAWPLHPNVIEKLGKKDAVEYLKARKAQIEDAERDPLYQGYEPAVWDTVDWHIADLRKKFPKGVIKIIIFGGHRSAKTRKASNYVNKALVKKAGSRWWACDSTEAQSRANQMRLIWEQFPSAWKGLERDGTTDIRYSQADGFSKNLFVCPNKSELHFKFYSMDVESLPGNEIDGVWCDELVPLAWVDFLGFRCANRNGIILITFCPEFGWNETFGHFYEGAQVIEQEEAPLLPKRDDDGNVVGKQVMPRVMQCQDPTARIIFFWTQDNPFGNYDGLVQELKSKRAMESEISIRAYGVCTRSRNAAFPMFNKRAHVITTQAFKEIVKQYPNGDRFHLVDPCDGRMWFMGWVFCPRPDKWIIYREFPSHGHKSAYIEGVGMPGPWALSGEALDGVKGPGQDSKGFSLERYREEIEKRDAGENVRARYIDSRYATSPRIISTTVTNLQEQLGEVGIDFLTMVPGKGRIIGGENNDGSIDMINSALFYDAETEVGKFSAKLSRLNEPQLQVVETCPNVIDALEYWTGDDGQKGARKDPIDVLRGLFLSGINYVGEDQYAWKGGGIPR
jgi:phage terminase large subunit-like protein